jgi:hypothetical protein
VRRGVSEDRVRQEYSWGVSGEEGGGRRVPSKDMTLAAVRRVLMLKISPDLFVCKNTLICANYFM